MLLTLRVKNFALIEDIDINFEEGLTVLTGETGTGKTIILESLHLLFGARSDQDMIRYGEDKAEVFGMFKINEDVRLDFELPEVIEIMREVDSSGRHKMKLNDKVVTLSYIKKVMNKVGNMHSQSDTMMLLDPSSYLKFIDQVDESRINILKNNYLMLRSTYLEEVKHLNKLKSKKAEDIEKQEFYEYQLKEINNFHLKLDEKQELEKQIDRLSNFDKISTNLNEIYQSLDSDNFNDASLYDAGQKLEQIKEFGENFKQNSEELLNMYYMVSEIRDNIFNEIDKLDFDPNEFDAMQERMFELTKLEDKYNLSINEIIAYASEIEEKLELITNYDGYINEYEKKVSNAFKKAFDEAFKLSEYRKKLSLKLTKNLISELKDLNLPKSKIKIVFDKTNIESITLGEDGIDNVDFHISLNEGEPIKPLTKVASGGERARFMFALKSIYAKQQSLSLLVLDEIDIGISGKTAAMVANKMQSISKDLQLIVISHLPQVAARANNHYGIDKELINNRMVTNISKLTYDMRVKKIAMMLSDESLSHYAIEQAKMLLDK